MGLEQVASNLIVPYERIDDCAVLLDGDQVLIGYGYDASTHRGRVHGPGGLVLCDAESATLLDGYLLPQPLEVSPSVGGDVRPIAGGASIAVLIAESIPYEPARSLLAILDRRSRSWAIHRRTPESQRKAVVGHARGSAHLIQLNECGPAPVLEVMAVASSGVVRSASFATDRKPLCLAVDSSLSSFAYAHDGGVVWRAFEGGPERNWPMPAQIVPGAIRRLWFAEDDLALVGLTVFEVVLHQWDGGVHVFKVPSMEVRAFEPGRRTALFLAWSSRSYVELDLSSGLTVSAGSIPECEAFDVDLKRRRVATWDHGMLRVFQMD